MDVHIQHIPASVAESDGLLFLAVDVDFLQPAKLPNAVIDVDDVVARLQGREFF